MCTDIQSTINQLTAHIHDYYNHSTQ